MALIAACVLTPGVYFAINAPVAALGTTAESAALAVQQWGFVLQPGEMDALAKSVGESSLLSRTGGAPSLAVGMAHLFDRALGGGGMALWYHFAIMFEALFILTTLDAGTRVGRFMLQDLGGQVWPKFREVTWQPAVWMASAIFVSCWGFFLYQGVTDPLGGINSLWPLFGIANQLLAAVALCVGTTVIIRMGKARYAWVTLLPLCWLLVVVLTAGWQKLFSADPRIGFLAHAARFSELYAAGTVPPGVPNLEAMPRMIFNDRLDAAVAAFFLVSVLVIVFESVRIWLGVVQGRIAATSTEVPRQSVSLFPAD
jgi:carbon starvation protein